MDGGSPPRGDPEADDFARFSRFVAFFCRAFKDPELFKGVPGCKPGFADYVPHYYRKIFTAPEGMTPRALKWFGRLGPLLSSLPRGASILDYGAGYGMDAIFLASCGYRVVFYEVSANHLAVGAFLKGLWERENGPLDIQLVQADRDRRDAVPDVDAILLNEVAHHVEPPEELFAHCARILSPGGRVFLLEPNALSLPTQLFFFRARGFKTVVPLVDEATGRPYLLGNENIRLRSRWDRLARGAGLRPAAWHPVIPYFLRSEESLRDTWRRALAATPGLRSLVASHITHVYEKPAEDARRAA